MARDRFKTKHASPWLAWTVVGVLLVALVALLGVFTLRPGRSPAEDAQTAAAIRNMDDAQGEADARREEKHSAEALL